MAKPLANGYPIGAVLIRDEVAEVMSAGTYIGHSHCGENETLTWYCLTQVLTVRRLAVPRLRVQLAATYSSA